jgi:hypothetical protein
MLEKLKENTIKFFAEAMTKLARLGNINPSQREGRDTELKEFTLDELIQCFAAAKKETFLTERPIEALIESLVIPETGGVPSNRPTGFARDMAEEEFELGPETIPEGTRITLVICPTDRDGLQLPTKYLDDTQNEAYPYFQLLYSNPKDKSGNALGMENIWPAPYLKMYSKELVDQTSFVVEYTPGKDRKEGESDFEYFSRMLREKYSRLQELTHGSLPE